MADENATPEEGTIFATLVRGRVYYLGDKEFLAGKPVPVTKEQADWLRDRAVDQVSVEGESEFQNRSKFDFSNSADEQAPKTRTRSR